MVFRFQVQDKEITFSWNPGNDGFAPLRYYSVQYSLNNGGWQLVPDRVDPALSSYTVTDLEPFKFYKFRIQAVNDIGPSGWSEESNVTRTLPSSPSGVVKEVKVRIFKETYRTIFFIAHLLHTTCLSRSKVDYVH